MTPTAASTVLVSSYLARDVDSVSEPSVKKKGLLHYPTSLVHAGMQTSKRTDLPSVQKRSVDVLDECESSTFGGLMGRAARWNRHKGLVFWGPQRRDWDAESCEV